MNEIMPSYEIAELIINVTGQMDSLLTIGFNSTASMNGILRAAWCTGRITTPMTDILSGSLRSKNRSYQ